MNYLASPPLVVAYALAGRMDVDLFDEPLGEGPRRRARLPARHLALAAGDPRRRSSSRCSPRCSGAATARSSRATSSWNALDVPEGDRYAWDPSSTYVKHPPYFEGMPADAPDDFEQIDGRAHPRAARRQRHHRPHLAGRRDQEGLAGRQLPDRARRRAEGLQLLRLAARQPRGDDARHLRQRAPAQPARARHRGRLHRCTCRTASRRRSTTPRWSTRTRACRSACSRARSTAPARRATGPPRGRACSASAS